MAVRNFDGSDDLLAFPLANFGAPVTFAMLCRKTVDNGFLIPMFACNSAGDGLWGLLDCAGVLGWADNNNSSETTLSFAVADGWVIIAGSHPGGSPNNDGGRLHVYDFDTDTWGHMEGDAPFSDMDISGSTGVGGLIQIGDINGLPFGGRVATVAVWTGELSDLEVESLSTNLATQDWFDVDSANLELLADLNQASTATTIEDLSGNGRDQSALVGTNVVTTDDPPGWTFGVGAGGEAHSGTGSIIETVSLAATGRKAAAGVGSIVEAAALVSVGQKGAASTAEIVEAVSLVAAGLKNAFATAQITETVTMTATGSQDGVVVAIPYRTLLGVGI